uniref:Uncharacterized protein n=1 Tax=Steinernema glaseri TaxID=37863 RepID=A0A1I7Z2T4_9BILA
MKPGKYKDGFPPFFSHKSRTSRVIFLSSAYIPFFFPRLTVIFVQGQLAASQRRTGSAYRGWRPAAATDRTPSPSWRADGRDSPDDERRLAFRTRRFPKMSPSRWRKWPKKTPSMCTRWKRPLRRKGEFLLRLLVGVSFGDGVISLGSTRLDGRARTEGGGGGRIAAHRSVLAQSYRACGIVPNL